MLGHFHDQEGTPEAADQPFPWADAAVSVLELIVRLGEESVDHQRAEASGKWITTLPTHGTCPLDVN